MKKLRQAFGVRPSLTIGLLPGRTLFFGVAFVFALAVGARQFETHVRAGTSPAPTDLSGAAKLSGGATTPAKADKKSDGDSRFAKLELGAGHGTVRVHYVSYGKASGKKSEALVLIHGWTMNVDNWRDQIPEFAKRSRVIAIDLPGHGQSDKPQVAYSMNLFARAIEAVLHDAKEKRAVLVGHSMGTPVARQFYRKYPEKTLAIVIVDGALRPFGDKAMMARIIENFRGPNYQQMGAQIDRKSVV